MERSRPVVAGLVTALVGFTSSFTVVLAGLRAVGADQRQAGSGLLVLCVLMGVAGIGLSARHRLPISVAWSTPGAALLVSTRHLRGGFGAAVGAFLVCGVLTVATGALRPLRLLVLSVPSEIANGVLAGVLVELCVGPVTAASHEPAVIAPVVVAWLVAGRLTRRAAVPVAMAVALVEILLRAHGLAGGGMVPGLVVTRPTLDLSALTLGLSLFVVTMASQNVPGLAVLESFGVQAPVGEAMTTTGAATLAGATLGGHIVNLAAITAALCAGPEAGEDPARRWIASATAGGCYVVLGLSAGALASLVAHAPAGLVETVAALALLPTLGAALASATAPTAPTAATGPPTGVRAAGDGAPARGAGAAVSARAAGREAAVVTVLVTASGVAPLGIGSPFWGLASGLAMLAVGRLDTRLAASRALGASER